MGALFQTGGFKAKSRRSSTARRCSGSSAAGWWLPVEPAGVGPVVCQPSPSRDRSCDGHRPSHPPRRVAGMNPKESEELTGLIGKLRTNGASPSSVEHDMGVVRTCRIVWSCSTTERPSHKATTTRFRRIPP